LTAEVNNEATKWQKLFNEVLSNFDTIKECDRLRNGKINIAYNATTIKMSNNKSVNRSIDQKILNMLAITDGQPA